MTTKHSDETCIMSERIVQLETKQQFINSELSMYHESIEKNTEAINKLCKTLIEHETIIKQQQNHGNHFYAIITGVIVGVIMIVANALVKIL